MPKFAAKDFPYAKMDNLGGVVTSGDLSIPYGVAYDGWRTSLEEEQMDHKTFFLSRWEKEAPATRKVISRIPEGSDYRPDPKSRTAREIAWLIVREEAALVEGLERGVFEWTEVPAPNTVKEVIALYERQHDELTKRLKAVAASRWEEQTPFMWGGQEVMKDLGAEMAWGFLLDQVHHRGQLSTYLRPMGAKVPAIYGPSADEGM